MADHQHKFSILKVYPIKKVQPLYHGTPGDMAWLNEKCETCPKVRPRDFGTTDDMKLKLKEMGGA